MDFLNQALAQLTDLFKSMTPATRITSALLLAVVVVSLGYLFTAHASGPGAYLMGGEPFSAGELAAMEAAFGSAGLDGYEIDGGRVRIPRGQQSRYMAALADEGALPANFGDYFEKAVSDTSVFISEKERQQRLALAKEAELGLILREMKEIEKAAVQYDSQQKGGLKRERIATASVMVKPLGNRALGDETVEMIRNMVSGAFADLKPEDVVVSDLTTGRSYRLDDPDGTGIGASDPYFKRTQQYREAVENSIANALSYVQGVVVTAHVELDKEKSHHEERVEYDPKKSAPRSQIEETENVTSSKAGPAGRVGLEGQSANAQASLPANATGTSSSEDRTNRQTFSELSHQTQQLDFMGMTPKQIKVAISVPRSYFKKLWHERNPAAEGEEPKTPEPAELAQIESEETTNIRAHAANLIITPEGVEDATTLVNVQTFTDIAERELPEPGLASTMLGWLAGNWSMLGILGLALVSLFILRSTIRSAPIEFESRASGTSPITTREPIEGEDIIQAAAHQLKRRQEGGPSLRDELAELVRDDPDAAANVLRGWISNAG